LCTDTFGIGYMAPKIGDAEINHFCSLVRGEIDVRVAPIVEGRSELLPVRWSGEIPGLGRLTLNRDGFVQHQRSLQKTRQELLEHRPPEYLTNVEVLSHRQANETFQELTLAVESLLPFVDRNTLTVHRADIVYQRKVQNSMQTIEALKGAMKPTRKGVSWFDNKAGQATGIMLNGNAVSHRAYDKGLESGDEAYYNVVRSEEQLRSRAVALGRIVDLENRTFNREMALETLNERYLDVAYEEYLDVTPLLNEGRDTMALLVLHPEFQEIYRERVKKSGYYKMKKQVREYRAKAIPDDMRVPENAWLE
jgi:hypothetical protein